MIAESAFRRKGLASEALQLLLSYATSTAYPPALPVPAEKFVVRIGDANTPSIKLFEKLGFVTTKHVAVFEEIEMRLGNADEAKRHWAIGKVVDYK